MKLLTSFLLCSALVFAGSSDKVSKELKQVDATSTVQVIVQWTIDAGEATRQKIAALGGTVVSEYANLKTGTYLIPAESLATLKADSNVKFVSVDRKLHKRATAIGITAATVSAPASWASGFNGAGVGVAILDSGITPNDNLGLALHAAVYNEDFTMPLSTQGDGKSGPKLASYGVDWYGHGEHVAGIIASNAKASSCSNCTQKIMGVAPGANLINLKVLDQNGEGSDSFVIAAINRAIELKNMFNIRVLNLSLGRPVYESYTQDPLCQAVEAAWKAGIVVVVAAGNDGRDNSFGNQGYGTIEAPGNDPYVITVGAMRSMGTADRSDDLIASYSSKGPTAVDHIVKPDILAPGNQVISLLANNSTLPLTNPQNLVSLAQIQSPAPRAGDIPAQPNYDSTSQPPNVRLPNGYSNKYYVMSGTSMAAAVVSGGIADLVQANPSLTPDQVKMLLMQTASKNFPATSSVTEPTSGVAYTSYYDLFTVGAGYMDLQAALALVKAVPSGLTAISPSAQFDTASGTVNVVADPTSVFADKSMWGLNVVIADKSLWGLDTTWSTSVLVGNKAMWGLGAVWSNSSDTTAQKAYWGLDAIWGNKSLWGLDSGTSALDVLIKGEP